jgi:hypothetical protein
VRPSLCLLAIALVAACPTKPAEGDFGEAKPINDDGTVRKIDAPPPAPPDFARAVALVSVFDKATSKVTVTLQIKPGFHAYAAGEEVGTPVDLVVDAPGSGEGAVAIPPGPKKDRGGHGPSAGAYTQHPLSATVTGGSGDVKGNVLAQVCTDKACDRPKKHPFTVPTT